MKLFIIAKNIIPKSHDIPAIILIVPRISIFLSSSWRSSISGSVGNLRKIRWVITMSVTARTIPTAHVIPSLPMMNPENTDTTVNTRPLTAPICPFALSRSPSLIMIVTRVERAIMRILPTKTPSIDMRMNTQSHIFHISCHIVAGKMRSIPNDIE